MTLWIAALTAAHAGYGDPIDGVPNHREREVHLWTSAVRVAPEAFAGDYPCSFAAFAAGEKTAKVPLWWHDGLGRIARAHSADMDSTGNLSHFDADGTPSIARLNSVYTGTYSGENVAEGYDEGPWSVVVEGWMCSEGHREGIMNPNYQDLGTGVVGRFWTQDFGGDDLDPTPNAARMGVHLPEEPSGSADYLLAVYTGSADPGAVSVVVNGEATRMTVAYGSPSAGIYEVTVPATDACTAYWFEVDGDSFPDGGAYGFGDCPFTDAEARWLPRSDIPALQDGADEDGGCGCTTSPLSTGWLALGLAGLLIQRRTR